MGKGRAARALQAALLGIIGGVALAARGSAATSPFDFTGHWTGTVLQGGQTATIEADLTSTGPKTFTGTVVVDETCTVTGKTKRHMKVALRVECSHSGSVVKVRCHLDPATETMEGTFAEFKQRRLRHRGTVMLTRQAGGGSTTTTTLPGAQASGHAHILHGPAPSFPPPRPRKTFNSPAKPARPPVGALPLRRPPPAAAA